MSGPDELGAGSIFVRYREVGGVCRPLILATIELGDESIDYLMLIDSGADGVVLPFPHDRPLGLEPSECWVRRAFALTGQTQGLEGPSFLFSFPELWPEKSFESGIVFAEMLEGRDYGLLGRDPTYDHISVRFGNDLGFGYYLRFA